MLYAEGDIVDGEAPEREVGGETLAAKLADLRRDEEVKAVVLRVNSPGGSALASEVIWHEMERSVRKSRSSFRWVTWPHRGDIISRVRLM